ncbi:MAG: hypothetical protein FJ137_21650 [Deltaproteobacteria bacterium]|nr:hypothetical protein [Deltaproteobacteria bacterium]
MNVGETLQRFSATFGVPFLLGRRCIVADPLGRTGLDHIRHGLAVDVLLKDACDAQFVEAALLCDVTPASFDEDAATLLYAAHELFATTHPQATAVYARAHLFAAAAAAAVGALPRSVDPGRLVTRHLVVRRIFRTLRTDVHVKWWTGKASFYGDEPPSRLVAWPGMRRVQQSRLTQPLWRIALQGGDEDLRTARLTLMVALLDASPLTRLVLLGDVVQKSLGFSLLLPWRSKGRRASPLDVLEDRRLARFVTDVLLADGLEQGGAALALALLQGLREGTSPAVLRRAAELCTHLALTACLIEGLAPGAPEARPLVAFLDGDPSSLHEGTRVYWAVVAATLHLAADDGPLSLPAAADLPAAAAPLFERLRQRCTHKRVAAVAEPLQRELARRLPRTEDVVVGPDGKSPDDDVVGDGDPRGSGAG